MQEFVSDAVVLDKEPLGEADSRITLYTEKCGKVIAKATGGRKITSRLAGHLEPGSIACVRIVGNRGGQVADAYAVGALVRTAETLRVLRFLSGFLLEGETDPAFWEYLRRGSEKELESRHALAVLGFDPTEAGCAHCGSGKPEYFESREARFVCEACARRNRVAEGIFRW